MTNKKKSDDPALDALIAGTKHAIRGAAKGIRAGFKKAPLLATLITVSVPFLAICIALLAQVKAVNDNPFAEMKAMGYTTIIVFFVLTLLIHVGLLSLIVFITKKISKAKVQADPEVDHGVQNLYEALCNSIHLMDYFADSRDVRFRDPGDRTLINTPARIAEVQRKIVHVKRLPSPIEQFEVLINLTKSDESFQAILPSLKNELKADEIRKDASLKRGGYYQLIIIPNLEADPLRKTSLSAPEFYSNYPMANRSWNEIIVGKNENLELQKLPVANTLIGGVPGSGKGSAFMAYLNHYCIAPPGEVSFFDQGLVRMHAIDPKWGDLWYFKDADIFDPVVDPETGRTWRVASPEANDIDLTIAEVYRLLMNRSKYNPTLKFVPTERIPARLLLIDELPTARSMMSSQADEYLVQIQRLGRQRGIYVVAASQSILQKDIEHRNEYSIRVGLRMNDPAHAPILFGDSLKTLEAAGTNPFNIPPATDANNWATAGEGFMKHAEKGTYDRFRYFHSTEQDRFALLKDHLPEDADLSVADIPDDVDF